MRRPRRLRKSAAVRAMVQEHRVNVSDFISPLFLKAGKSIQEPISSMPGQFRFSTDLALKEIESCMQLGIQSFVLFPQIEERLKDSEATYSYHKDNFYLKAISEIKAKFPEAYIMTDVAMDPYSSDGHDGLVVDGIIQNDETLDILGKMALAQAAAGADVLGPSDMMDGRIGYLREVLDEAGYTDVALMAYTAKYASAFYGPFRDALNSAPKAGDKKSYQMDPANATEALLEAELDFQEGADFLMVKPALAYLDIIRSLYDQFDIPITAYNVSGEYAMIKAAAANGWINGEAAMMECLLSIKRAGATSILTYFAKEAALVLKNKGA
jgi:porphobilinogen synthase